MTISALTAACGQVDNRSATQEVAGNAPASSGSSAAQPSSPSGAPPLNQPSPAPAGAGGSTGMGPSAGGSSGFGGAPGAADAGAADAASNTGDKYVSPGTNPFVLADRDPFSTFAVDVDTASYDIFRRDVNNGTLPQPASVRLEEYVNAFAYDYPPPAPEEEAPFKVSMAAAGQVFDRPTLLFRVGIAGRKPPPQERRAANLVFLVDVSGSMDVPNKLPLVRKTLIEAVEFLDPGDKVSIVTYAADTSVRLGPTSVQDSARIISVIEGLKAGGSTAGASGIDLAYQQASAGFIQNGINHVILCTDGDFNVGVSDTKALVQLIRSKRQTGVTLTVLGYGVGNLNDDMMEKVSNAGNGIYGMISDEDQMRRYVRERLLSTLVHIAKDVKIQVEFNPTKVHAYRLLGYENRAIADSDFRNDGIDAGEIGAGHKVTALYELVLAGQPIPERAGAPAPSPGEQSQQVPREIATTDLALVKVRWKTIDASDATPAKEVNTSLGADDVLESLGEADPDMKWAAAIAAFAERLKKSPYADPLQDGLVRKIVAEQAMRDADRGEFAALFEKAAPRLEAR